MERPTDSIRGVMITVKNRTIPSIATIPHFGRSASGTFTASPSVPISHKPIQKIAQDRAVRTCKLSPSNEALRGEVKSLGQGTFDFWPVAFYRPVMVGKCFGDLDSNARPVVRFKKGLEQPLPHVFADFCNGI